MKMDWYTKQLTDCYLSSHSDSLLRDAPPLTNKRRMKMEKDERSEYAELVKRLIGPQSAEIDYATRQEAARAIEVLMKERDEALADANYWHKNFCYSEQKGREAGIREAAEKLSSVYGNDASNAILSLIGERE
jgi:hypothetical protein